jgi:hypothetical protein
MHDRLSQQRRRGSAAYLRQNLPQRLQYFLGVGARSAEKRSFGRKWVDNTAEKNFTDSIGSAPSYLKAQYRFKVTIAREGAYNGVSATKISVQKEQLIQVDVLEGWLSTETNAIEENTLLYRIGRLIWIKGKQAQLEEQKTQQQIQESEHL